VEVYDPWVDAAEAKREYGVEMTETPDVRGYDCMVVAVAHEVFAPGDIVDGYSKAKSVIFDVKGILPRKSGTLRL